MDMRKAVELLEAREETRISFSKASLSGEDCSVAGE